jgi:CheY-like chemotaxis protein
METRRPHVLVVDDAEGRLTDSLAQSLAGYDVDVARDAFDAIYCIDCASRPYELIFCDLARGDLPGPELWAYLSITRSQAAARMVFVASGRQRPETIDFLAKTTNTFVQLPLTPMIAARAPKRERTGRQAPTVA